MSKKLNKFYYTMQNTPSFHALDEGDFPEDNECVLWWHKGVGEAPYIGTMVDNDFPGIEDFFAWCECPNPRPEFWNHFNVQP